MKRLPWTLYRYLGRELLVTFLLCLLFVSLLILVVSSFQAVTKGYSLRIIIPWVLESSGYYLFFTVPVSLLFASTLVYGRFVGEREYTAAAASGILPLHIFAPLGVIAACLTAVALLTQGTVFPETSYKKRNLPRYLIKQFENLGDGYQRYLPIPDGRVYVEEHHGRHLRDLRLVRRFAIGADDRIISPEQSAGGDSDKDGKPMTEWLVLAKEAEVETDEERGLLILNLKGVTLVRPHPDAPELYRHENLIVKAASETIEAPTLQISFPINEKYPRIPDTTTSELAREDRQLAAKATDLRARLGAGGGDAELGAARDELKQVDDRRRKISVEVWRRRNIAFSTFTFAFLGFPISITLRQRHRLQAFFIGTLLVMTLFYPLMLVSDDLGKMGLLPPAIALSIGNFLLFAIASTLTVRLLRR